MKTSLVSKKVLVLENTRKALSVLLSHPFFPILLLQNWAYLIEQHRVHSENPICSSARESLGEKCYGNTLWEKGGRKEGREMYCSHHQICTARLTLHTDNVILFSGLQKKEKERAFQKTKYRDKSDFSIMMVFALLISVSHYYNKNHHKQFYQLIWQFFLPSSHVHISLLKNAHAPQLTKKSLGTHWTGITAAHVRNPTVFFTTISWWKLFHPKLWVKVTHQQTISHLLWNWKKAAGAWLCPATLPAPTSHWNSCSHRKHSNPAPPVYLPSHPKSSYSKKKSVFYPKRATLIQPKVCDQRLDFDNILISAFENFRPFEPN